MGIDAERFWGRVERADPDSCWEWTRARFRSGYGALRNLETKQTVYAHRVAWELTNGAIEKGLCVLHRCDNRPCCNPNHLFLGTDADNVRDMDAKGRRRWMARPGIMNSSAKLTEDAVRQIRVEHREGRSSQRALARKHGVSPSAIRHIVRGKTWKNVL
jgi:hypothetical protein